MDRIEQFSIIAPDIGEIFRYMSIATALPLVVAVIYGEWEMILPMASVPVVLFLLGCFSPDPRRSARHPSPRLSWPSP
jgi:trk system potassium uptake protein TrkH